MSTMLLELPTELTGVYPFSFHRLNCGMMSAMETHIALPPMSFNFLLGLFCYHSAVFAPE